MRPYPKHSTSQFRRLSAFYENAVLPKATNKERKKGKKGRMKKKEWKAGEKGTTKERN